MRVSRYIATADDAGMRLDTMLYDRCLFASRSAAARAVEAGQVLVDGMPVAKEQLPPSKVEGQDIPLDIRFEDPHIIVLSKQAGLVCHPSSDHFDGTLVNALIAHCGAQNLCNVQGEDDRLGIVHRLDRDTTGLMLAAKSDEAGYRLMEDIRLRSVDRHYLALVHGVIAHETGMIDAPIARDVSDRTRMAVRDCPSAREAITTFTVLERFEAARYDDGYTLIDCKLFTGRTHQIRVHLQYTRHPIVGDPVYCSHGPRETVAQLGLGRQFLHSFLLAFTHPTNLESLRFADNLSSDLQQALDSLAPRSLGKTPRGQEVCSLLEASPVPSIEEWRYE